MLHLRSITQYSSSLGNCEACEKAVTKYNVKLSRWAPGGCRNTSPHGYRCPHCGLVRRLDGLSAEDNTTMSAFEAFHSEGLDRTAAGCVHGSLAKGVFAAAYGGHPAVTLAGRIYGYHPDLRGALEPLLPFARKKERMLERIAKLDAVHGMVPGYSLLLEYIPGMTVGLFLHFKLGGVFNTLRIGYPERNLCVPVWLCNGSNGRPPVTTTVKDLEDMPFSGKNINQSQAAVFLDFGHTACFTGL